MRETLKTNLVNTLTEGGVVLEDKAVDKVLDALIAQKVLEIKKFKNLEGLTLGTTPPVAAFLINGFIVSVYAQSQEQKKYWAEYMEQVRENDVCEYEFTYEEFLRSKDLLDEINETITVNNYFVTVDKAGKIYLSMKKRKETLEGELVQINTALPIIEPVIKDVFPM
jgi:hypothetical protein